jgi:hypothetical protein
MSNTVSTVLDLRPYPINPVTGEFPVLTTPKQVNFTNVGDTHLLGPSFTITGASQTNPVVITTLTAHGYSNGDNVYITNIVGMTPLNGRSFVIAGATTFTFQLFGEDGTGYPAYISGGIVRKLL